MPGKMSVMGVGLKAGAVVGGTLVLTAVLSFVFSPVFQITSFYGPLMIAGVALAVVGFALNLVAAFDMLAAHKKNQLASGWTYRIFLNPMYFFQVFITLPGIALLFNSWLVLTAVPIGAVAVNLLAREEQRHLENEYGDAYRAYRNRVPIRF